MSEELTTGALAEPAEAEVPKQPETTPPEANPVIAEAAEQPGPAESAQAEAPVQSEITPPEADPVIAEAAEQPELAVSPEASESTAPGEVTSAPPLEQQAAEPALPAGDTVDADDLVVSVEIFDTERARRKAIIEAAIYITDEPLTAQQIAMAIGRPIDEIKPILDELTAEYSQPDRGLSIREVAGGFKMATKPEHHEEIRNFVKNLKPPLKLSLAALETLAVIAYKQPITAPEIMEIRGVQGAGVLKTLLDRKLIATAGRKNVIGKPILYKTTKEFLVQFGLRDLAELPTLKEFEELGRLALTDAEAEPSGPLPLMADPAAIAAAAPDDILDSTSEPPIEEPPVEEPPDQPPHVEEPPASPDQPEQASSATKSNA